MKTKGGSIKSPCTTVGYQFACTSEASFDDSLQFSSRTSVFSVPKFKLYVTWRLSFYRFCTRGIYFGSRKQLQLVVFPLPYRSQIYNQRMTKEEDKE